MSNKLRMIFSRQTFVGLIHIFTKYLPAYAVALFSKKSGRPLWIISERRDEARDNGYRTFCYIREQHPEVEVYYAIDKAAPDYKRVEPYGNIIQWGSFRHYLTYMKASVIISTGFDMGRPDIYVGKLMDKLLRHRAKKAFLQHGITKDYMAAGTAAKMGADLFVCGGKPEYDYIKEHFGYTGDEVQYIGFARYDGLAEHTRGSTVIYMPTWRTWLDREPFEQSDYYRAIRDFLSSEQLGDFLAESGMRLVYFTHPHIKRHKHLFDNCAGPNIEIANNDDYDLQELMKASAAMITDYSSVFFDMAYMNKPVIYYQFDYEQYRRHQYPEGYFSYRRDGFGPVVDSADKVIAALRRLRDNGWDNPAEYAERTADFFPMRDTKNCERTYAALCALEERKA